MRPHRLPTGIRSRDADAQLLSAEAQPSGVRVVVRTTARQVALELRASRVVYRGVQRPRGVVDVVVDGGAVRSTALEHGDSIEVDLSTGASTPRSGDADVVTVTDLQPGEKQIEFWLPHNEQVELIALHTDEPVGPGLAGGRVWVHHGSSISHGSNATRPTGIWPVVAARRAGVDLINLGFGGSALVDPFMARLIRDTPADVISLKLGINVVNLDAMRLRSFVPAVHGFLDTIREGHPTTPLLLVSPIHCGIHEDTPGPGAFDPEALASGVVRFVATGEPSDADQGRLTLRVIREQLAQIAAARSDAALQVLDGRTLYGPGDAETDPLPDALHPSASAHRMMGERFADIAFGPGGPLAEVPA
ncbi:SGNH/GDSL hydrolase family protein [Curtobacterium sp. MCLR17_007]|nr:SGNH/GDSL hydrolase family protein [Curtobacterium sp. MCLR17_007]WIB60203.1 SGNH/GDSL hydrolase family protein [Curtobacterium sp. MCLR17_007]